MHSLTGAALIGENSGMTTQQFPRAESRAFNIGVTLFGLTALVAIMCSGCRPVPEVETVVKKVTERLIHAPAIELVLHGEDAERVKRQAVAYGGVVDVQAVTIGNLIVYLEPGAFQDEGIRRHEYQHVLDFRAEGPVFGLRYALEDKLVGYENNRYEVRARLAQDDPKAPTADVEVGTGPTLTQPAAPTPDAAASPSP
jgi:hypothetical protein